MILLDNKTRVQFSDIFLSILIHFLVLTLFSYFLPTSGKNFKGQELSKFKVSLNKKNVLPKNLKTVGVKDGKKDGMSMIKPPAALPAQAKKTSTKEPFSLESLGAQDVTANKYKNSVPSLKEIPPKKKSLEFLRLSGQEVQKRRKINLHSDIKTQHINALDHSKFDIKLEIPEGVSENELNKIEQIFYGFKRRVFETYVSSFIRNVDNFQKSYPNYHYGRQNKTVTLVGKITFDSQGSIKKIEILRPSNEPALESLFTETLKGILKLPNPPKNFVRGGNGFSIFYRLIIQ